MDKVKAKIFKTITKWKKKNDTDNSNPDVNDPLYENTSSLIPSLPTTPIPKRIQKKLATGKTLRNHAIDDLPLQHVSSNRRMEDLDDEEYGYTTNAIIKKRKEKEICLEDTFMDAGNLDPYKEDSHYPMINRFFFGGRYKRLSFKEIRQDLNKASPTDTQYLKKFIHLLQSLKTKNKIKITEIFNFLTCKSRQIKNLCIQEITEMILVIDHTQFSGDDLRNLYEIGTDNLFATITETRSTFSIFQPLIRLGIVFNCFIFLEAIKAKNDWVSCIRRVESTIQSKYKRVIENGDSDVRVFVKTAKCIFDLDKKNLDYSLLFPEDVDDFLPELKKNDNGIYIEGLSVLFHTGNLTLRQQSKRQQLKIGVQRLVGLSLFIKGSNEAGMAKWFHCLLGHFVVRILQQEYPNVKQDVLDRCRDQLFSILKCDTLHSDGFELSHCLLYHHNDKVRSRYRDIAKTGGIMVSKSETKSHIQTLLIKCGLLFDLSESEMQLNTTLERKLCTFCGEDASITCFYEEESENMLTAKFDATENHYIKENLENELEVLKEIESKDLHLNVTRLLAFNQSLPRFYIKERLPGDNLQRRLLKAREKGKIIPIVDLIKIIIQAVKAVIYVHNQGCLLRDITTASYGCMVSDDEYFLKLKNFEMAVRPSNFSEDGIVNGVIDLDFKGVPIRWAAPESLLKGHYSIYSDVWSVNILADEILDYAAWPYSDISDSNVNDLATYIIFTHLKPQGFNRPRRVHGLILEGLATVPEQRLKLEALKERLLEPLDKVDGEESYNLYDTYCGVEGIRTKSFDIPPLTEHQIKVNSVFERGIPESIQRYRELEDPVNAFKQEIAEKNSRLKEQTGMELTEISSVDNYKISPEGKPSKMKVMEKVTDDFLNFTYNKLNQIDSSKMCVEPWPPSKSGSIEGTLYYSFPRSTHLLDIVLHKHRGETIGPYIELLYELANHVNSFHSAGWIFRCLRAKHVWILETTEREQTIVVPKFGEYRMIASSKYDAHLEQIKVKSQNNKEGVQWLPIEAIKGGLYSKESDVYAFGMVTWEVMTAFGQEGVVYDQDEDREMSCIPFNYQESKNILQHLIEGYIPEKPVKCPDWFYQEVTRPCLLHQKIDRPSILRIVQILDTRLGRTLPKPIISPASAELDRSNETDKCNPVDYDSKLKRSNTSKKELKMTTEDIVKSSGQYTNLHLYYNADKGDSRKFRGRILPPPPKHSDEDLQYEEYDDVANQISSQDDIENWMITEHYSKTSSPKESVIAVSYYNARKKESQENRSSKLTSPPPYNDDGEFQYDYPEILNPLLSQHRVDHLMKTTQDNNTNPPVGKNTSPLSNPTSYNTNILPDVNKDDEISLPESSVSVSFQTKLNQNHHDEYFNDLSPTFSQSCMNNSNSGDGGETNSPWADEKKKHPERVHANKNHYVKLYPLMSQKMHRPKHGVKTHHGNFCPQLPVSIEDTQASHSESNRDDNVYRNSINISSDDYDTAPRVVLDEMRDTFKGSDFDWSKSQSGTLGCTQKGSDFDSTYQIDINSDLGVQPSSVIKPKPKVPPKPKVKPKTTMGVND